MAKQKRKSDCPINFAMEIFGDQWTFLIVRDLLFKNKKNYNDFLNAGEKVATNILADRLLRLEENGIITKDKDPEHGSKWVYQLTSKGVDLTPLLVEVILWSAKCDKNSAADEKFIKRAKKNKEELIKEIILGHEK